MLCSGSTAKVLAATVPLSLSPGLKYSEMQSAFSVSKCGESLEKKVLLGTKLVSEHTSRCTECVMEVLLCVLLMRPYQREREEEGETERLRGCVCFHLLHNREWRQRVLPRLPHYSGSSGGGFGSTTWNTLVYNAQNPHPPTTSTYISECAMVLKVTLSRRCLWRN